MNTKSKYRAVIGGMLASGLFIIGASTTVAASTGDLGMVPIATSPSDVVWDTIDSVFSEVASIGSAILFAYGFFHLIKIGTDSGDTSGSITKLGISWGLGIAIQSWRVFQSFVRNQGTVDSSMATPDPSMATMVTEQTTNLLLAIGYLPL